MSLAGALQAGPTSTRRGPRCSVDTLLRSLPDEESRALAVMLADDGWLGSNVAKVIRKEVGVSISGTTIQRHRRGDCSCEPV